METIILEKMINVLATLIILKTLTGFHFKWEPREKAKRNLQDKIDKIYTNDKKINSADHYEIWKIIKEL